MLVGHLTSFRMDGDPNKPTLYPTPEAAEIDLLLQLNNNRPVKPTGIVPVFDNNGEYKGCYIQVGFMAMDLKNIHPNSNRPIAPEQAPTKSPQSRVLDEARAIDESNFERKVAEVEEANPKRTKKTK